MNLQEMKEFKEKLITQGHEAYPAIAKIVDTLGEKKLFSRKEYMVLEHDGITLIHHRDIAKAKIEIDVSFEKWLYRDNLFVTVGEPVPSCPFRSDRVMCITLDNEETVVTEKDRELDIFTPYHMDWYNRILTLLPKAESILAEVSQRKRC